MKFMQKNYLAMAVAGAAVLGGSTVQAVTFTASSTLQSSLEVTVVQEFEVGTVFATEAGSGTGDFTDGVGAFAIGTDGTVADVASSATVSLTSLGGATPAQGSVAVVGDFILTLPATSTIVATDFVADATTTLQHIGDAAGNQEAIELQHESLNPAVPSLYMMHFTVGDVSGGVVAGGAQGGTAAANDGVFNVAMDFGETEYVFNIGATITTKPVNGTAETYQDGIYSGTFEVTAAY